MASAETFTPSSTSSDRLPIFGAIAREWADGDANFPLYLVLALILAWAGAVVLWGLPALYLPAVALSPVALLTLIAIGRG